MSLHQHLPIYFRFDAYPSNITTKSAKKWKFVNKIIFDTSTAMLTESGQRSWWCQKSRDSQLCYPITGSIQRDQAVQIKLSNKKQPLKTLAWNKLKSNQNKTKMTSKTMIAFSCVLVANIRTSLGSVAIGVGTRNPGKGLFTTRNWIWVNRTGFNF